MSRFMAMASAVLLPATAGIADDVTYTSPTGGAFSWGTSWDTGAPPVWDDNAIFDHVGIRPVWLPWDYETDRLIVEHGTLTLQLMDHDFTALNEGTGSYVNMGIQVGMHSGDLGILDIEGPGTLTAHALSCGVFSGAGAWTNVTEGATLILDDGHVGAAGGWGAIAVTDASTFIVEDALWLGINSLGSLGIHGDADADVSSLIIGNSDEGTLDVTDGSLRTFLTVVGWEPNGDGEASVAGTNAYWNVDGVLWVGDEGTGLVDISDGGFVYCEQWLNVGSDIAGNGTVEVGTSGIGTLWVDWRMNIGGSHASAGGDGLLHIHPGGTVDNLMHTVIYPYGTVVLDGGHLLTDDIQLATTGGFFDWNSGTLTLRGEAVDVDDRSGIYDIDLWPSMTLVTTEEINFGDDLTTTNFDLHGGSFTANIATYGAALGERGSTFIHDGEMTVNTLAIGGSTIADGGEGTVSVIETGALDVNGTARIWPDGLLGVNGFGVIVMQDLDVAGGLYLTSSTGASVVSSDLSSGGPGILVDGLDETRVDVYNGGELDVEDANIGTVGGGRGVVFVADGLFVSPTITVGTTLGDAVEARLELDGGTIQADTITVREDGHLSLALGTVDLTSGTIDIHGRLDPGANVIGDVVLHPTAHTHVELRGAAMSQTHSMSVVGALSIDGTLHIDATNPDLAVALGDTVALLHATTLSGAFDALVVTGDLGALRPVVRQVGQTIEVVITNRSDVNGDGVVDVADLLAVIAEWGACGDPCDADVNGDGIVDVSDMLTVIADWT